MKILKIIKQFWNHENDEVSKYKALWECVKGVSDNHHFLVTRLIELEGEIAMLRSKVGDYEIIKALLNFHDGGDPRYNIDLGNGLRRTIRTNAEGKPYGDVLEESRKKSKKCSRRKK